jgi:hypothetical protein
VSLSTKRRPSWRARCRPTVDLPQPGMPTRESLSANADEWEAPGTDQRAAERSVTILGVMKTSSSVLRVLLTRFWKRMPM